MNGRVKEYPQIRGHGADAVNTPGWSKKQKAHHCKE
jgi:hypothetical protein